MVGIGVNLGISNLRFVSSESVNLRLVALAKPAYLGLRVLRLRFVEDRLVGIRS